MPTYDNLIESLLQKNKKIRQVNFEQDKKSKRPKEKKIDVKILNKPNSTNTS